MCDCQSTTGVTRREAIAGALVVGSAIAIGAGISSPARAVGPAVPAIEVLPGLAIYPRDAWGANLPPVGPIRVETPQFLLVHHTASSNAYSSAAGLIQSAYAFHTSAAKGWSDVCYEFFIGRDGDVWEGRAGALTGPVVADATGGSQGFAQLVCMLGDFTSQLPTAAALDALVKVLAWLSDRDHIDISPGATTSFVSRGSQRWAAGTPVTTSTIAGHRDMSFTECPGDALYPVLPEIRARAFAHLDVWRTVLRPARRLGVVAL
ncbi:MAG TPA: peptidoglycan recognition family protein [Ilumatobacteraceae bacterium]|nr:peptidoglycan recognition family protein [Ilumatobacteraceae bacterium]